MKYPPARSAHWEGAVGQWLRGQLDARGIDAPAYGRYVLSLLTRPLDPADLAPSPAPARSPVSARRRPRTERRPAGPEALKRSAAVQCLLDASDDQNAGIEQLVDELCTKLKEVEEVDARNLRRDARANKSSRRERPRQASPAEMARLYYAAFPALVPSEPGPPVARPISRARPEADDRRRPKRRGQRERAGGGGRRGRRTDHRRGNERLPEWVEDGCLWDMDAHDPVRDMFGTGALVSYGGTLDAHFGAVPDVWAAEDGRPESPAEEDSMAKFKAKFDRSLEALWSKEPRDAAEGDLPAEFHDQGSPSDRMFDRYSADGPLPLSLADSVWSNDGSKFERRPSFGGSDSETSKRPKESDSMEILYSKLKPLNLDDGNETLIDLQESLRSEEFRPDPDDLVPVERRPLACVIRIANRVTPTRSFEVLNHDSSVSSFTEVRPRAPSGYVGDALRRRPETGPEMPRPPPDAGTEERDDEDLLTSMRTHFRPIKHDGNEQAAVDYADGVTFSVVSDLDSVKFSRSGSGSMFLESDTEPPRRYMEYRKQGIDYSRLEIGVSSVCSDEGLSSSDLVLKFRVVQTEKFVQTDDGTPVDASSRGSDDDSESNVRTLSADAEIEALSLNWPRCEECNTKNDTWSSNGWTADRLNATKIWSLDDNACKSCSDRRTAAGEVKSDSEKSKINEESAREWDELLSDLRYIHDLKSDNEWRDDMTSVSENCRMAPTEVSFRAEDGNFIKSALMAQKKETNVINDVRAWLMGTGGKTESNAVGKILDHSLMMYNNVWPHCEICSENSSNATDIDEGWRVDRKRRHSAVNDGKAVAVGVGKQRCTLPSEGHFAHPVHLPFLPATDRPLTR